MAALVGRSFWATTSTAITAIQVMLIAAEPGRNGAGRHHRRHHRHPYGDKAPNEPSWVAIPMSIPFICQTAMTELAAASPSVPVSAAAVAAG
jgi:hypothetical protein